MSEDQQEMLEQVVAEVTVLRSAVAVLLAAVLSPDALRSYRTDLPSPIEFSEIRGKTLANFSRDLDHGIDLNSRFAKRL